jgi:dTDP-4-amino-4,6-dideoxygalactose transaminase
LVVSESKAIHRLQSDNQTASKPAPVQAIPFYDGATGLKRVWETLQARLDEVFDHGKFSHGRQVGVLEDALCAYTGARHAIACNSGTDALVLLLRACGVGPGDEVVVPPFSFFATASSVALVGARPVFADLTPGTFDIDPVAVAAAITPRTKAVMPVHLFHQMADMTAIAQVAAQAGVALIEDSAEAIGMRSGGVHAGLLGRGGVLSFFPTKTLGAFGDAGMLLTDDDGIAELAAVLRHHGRCGQTLGHMPGISNEAVAWGYNSKMDDLQAAVLLARLTTLDSDIAARARLAKRYDAGLAGLEGLVATPVTAARSVPVETVVYTYVIQAERKGDLIAYLRAHGVETEEYYPRPLHLQPCFVELGYRIGDMPVAEDACRKAFALPLYPDMSEEAVERVCDLIRAFYGWRTG